jgi:pyridoxamine 5'-phosphate oxidase
MSIDEEMKARSGVDPFASMRIDYDRGSLSLASAVVDPFVQFRLWMDEAVSAGIEEVNAMTLATATKEGRPSARVVLLKGVGDQGFDFYTNRESRKGRELEDNPFAAITLLWKKLRRQVRVEGRVEALSAAESDQYFASRPRGSRLGAWASPQSQVVSGRAEIERRLHEVELRFGDEAVGRPPHWGGYRLLPDAIEFWQGRPSRLHDRLRYRRDAELDSGWRIERLAP